MGVTFKANYAACSKDLGVDLVAQPDRLVEPELGVGSAAWFWTANRLNAEADIGDIRGCRKGVNGGYNGLTECLKAYSLALEVLDG